MKKIVVCVLAVLLALTGTISAFSAATADVAPLGDQYSVVSAVVNKTYDFKDDFHDSYPYDEDFETEGIFKLDDYCGDVTLTLKNETTGETFTYQKTDTGEWTVKASVDHLLYETTQLDAQVHIYDLGGPYGITETDIPVTITVNSSQYSADFHRYPSYFANTPMYESRGDYTLDYDASTKKAKITVNQIPKLFWIDIYDVETKQTLTFDQENGNFVFGTEAEVENYDPSCGMFWFFIPGTLIFDDGYEFNFTLSVTGYPQKSTPDSAPEKQDDKGNDDSKDDNPATDDSAKATPDSGAASPDSSSKNAVKTGDSVSAFVLAGVLMIIGAAVLMMSFRKRKNNG